MPALRSDQTTRGRRRAGARALWRATGMGDSDFGKPIIAIANSYTQFVPGHVHLRDVGQIVAAEIAAAGGMGREFHTIAVDDGIAMGHDGMLYSLPSRDLIADSIEYVVNAHCADALVCISNCDKITPGMLMAAMRLDVPTIFVSGGPMESGRLTVGGVSRHVDLIDSMIASGDPAVSDAEVAAIERAACPTCGSCSGMFTANSMNCLVEALGLALPGNGSLLATHTDREQLFRDAGRLIVTLTQRWYGGGDATALPRGIATRRAFENAMSLDIAMGGSTNTVLHLLAAAHEGGVDFTLADVDRLSRIVPVLCKVAPSVPNVHMEDVHRAGGIFALLGELHRSGLLDGNVSTAHAATLREAIERNDVRSAIASASARERYLAAPGGVRTTRPFSQSRRHAALDLDRERGVIRAVTHAFSRDGGLAVLTGNLAPDGAIVKSSGVPVAQRRFSGPAIVFESEAETAEAILGGRVEAGDVVVIRYEGPRGGPGMQEMLLPTSYLRARGLAESCALVTDGRFSGGSAGLSIGHVSPEAAAGGAIALVCDGDIIEIDIDARQLVLRVDEHVLVARRAAHLDSWQPATQRVRHVSHALQAYAAFATSAALGAVRRLPHAHASS